MGVPERINVLLEQYNLKAADFASKVGVTPATISNLRNEKTGMSSQVAKKIFDNYPELNYNWILYGKGEMFQSKENQRNNYNFGGPNPITGELFTLTTDDNVENAAVEETNDLKTDKTPSNTKRTETSLKCSDTIINECGDGKEASEIPKSYYNKSRTIEKIIIYYNDKTFEEYDMTKCKL